MILISSPGFAYGSGPSNYIYSTLLFALSASCSCHCRSIKPLYQQSLRMEQSIGVGEVGTAAGLPTSTASGQFVL